MTKETILYLILAADLYYSMSMYYVKLRVCVCVYACVSEGERRVGVWYVWYMDSTKSYIILLLRCQKLPYWKYGDITRYCLGGIFLWYRFEHSYKQKYGWF